PHFSYRVVGGESFNVQRPSLNQQSSISNHQSSIIDQDPLGGDGARRAGEGPVKWKTQPLSDYALASRLSYFLWSSLPDAELLARAKAGDLTKPDVLISQARRMAQSDKVRGLATEFGGNWLDFRRFEEHNAVDRERFKTFTDELRHAMFEEP